VTRYTVAMLGARMSYAVPRALYQSGLLSALLTDVYLSQHGLRRAVQTLAGLPGAPSGLRALQGRYHPDLEDARVLSQRTAGLSNILRRRRADSVQDRATRTDTKRTGAQRLAAMLETLTDPGQAVFAFQEAAREPFEVAKTRGMACILEQSIAARPVALRLLSAELDQWRGWFKDGGLPQGGSEKIARLDAEWAMADHIIAASDFVRGSLIDSGVPDHKIKVFPYGVTLPAQAGRPADFDGTRPLRVLFAGNVQLRKGIHYLLQAAETLGPAAIELRVVGGNSLTDAILHRFASVADFRGRVPRAEMAQHFRWADVFALPSIVEGSATVVYEALSFGLPAVVTPNAGSVVEDGRDGQIIAAGSAEGIAQALTRYIEDPQFWALQANAAQNAGHKVSYDRYHTDLKNFFSALDVTH
jgi:glycosyltransferase involved in cell wall biosynthesis